MRTFYNTRKQQISTENTPLGVGGEGEVLKISSKNYSNSCIKLYHPKYRTLEKENKIEYMIQNQPRSIIEHMGCLCWPQEKVFDNRGKFVGFIMPIAFPNSILLYELVTLALKPKLPVEWHDKFARNSKNGLRNRLIVCINIASAIAKVHQLKKYVFVDIKPQNILINPSGHVSIIDLDSLQVGEQSNILYRARVSTAEYTPAEGQSINLSQSTIAETWDRFSLAVIFYEIIFGLHPCAGSLKGQFSSFATIPERISEGLFAISSKKYHFQIIPPPHNNFDKLPHELKILFTKAFDSGNLQPHMRPSATDWGMSLHRAIAPQIPPSSIKKSKPPDKNNIANFFFDIISLVFGMIIIIIVIRSIVLAITT